MCKSLGKAEVRHENLNKVLKEFPSGKGWEVGREIRSTSNFKKAL